MCCFSGPVQQVANTNIFARASRKGRQFLVYSMTFSADVDLAMILPLPVPKKSAEDAVTFINLEEYPEFFSHMKRGFPDPVPPSRAPANDSVKSAPPPAPLEVVQVGSFEASFVPTIKDFSRLDKRFRLPDDVWNKLPAYKNYGFAVFKLKPGEEPQNVHPMAFEFPRAYPSRLFFPTVHIHDGEVHSDADFDHALYCQLSGDEELMNDPWRESDRPAGTFMDADKALGIVAADQHCYLKELRGEFKNDDILV